jgi:cleavage stimulation factor subunit 2
VRVRIGLDKMTGRPRGFAFAEFGDDAKAADAIRRFDSVELRGRRLRVNDAADKPPPRAPRPPGAPSTGFTPRPGSSFSPRPMYSPDFPPPEVPPDPEGPIGGSDFVGRSPAGNKKGGSRRNLRARKRSLRW